MTSPHTTTDPFADTTVVAAPRPAAGPAPSEKQLGFLRRLAAERDVDLTEIEPMLDRQSASTWIDKLMAMPKTAPVETAPEGFHVVTVDGTPTVYKVQRAVHGAGRLYAKVLIPPRDPDDPTARGVWEYIGVKPLAWLSEDTLLTLEKAQEYGHLYGICCRCGATLTNENSIRNGIGPVCGSRF